RRVRRDQRVGAGELLEALEQLLLDVEPLDDGLDDEVAVLHAREIVFEVSDRDQDRVARVHECSRLGLAQLVERSRGNAIARGLRRVRCELAGNDVEQDDGDARVGAVRGDAAAHHACTEHGNASDRKCHARTIPWYVESWWRSSARAATVNRLRMQQPAAY